MSMYYLHRNGETSGPLAIGRLSQMWTAGEIGPDDLVCALGSEEWIQAEVIAGSEVLRDEAGWKATAKPKVVGKVTRRPYRAIGWVVVILGLGTLVTPAFLIGILLILIGLGLNRPHFHCGKCGNRVEKISVLCPTCRAALLPWSFSDSVRESRVSLIVLGLLLLAVGGFWVLMRFS